MGLLLLVFSDDKNFNFSQSDLESVNRPETITQSLLTPAPGVSLTGGPNADLLDGGRKEGRVMDGLFSLCFPAGPGSKTEPDNFTDN